MLPSLAPQADGFTKVPIAKVGFGLTVMLTVELEEAQGELAIVHWKT
jgi:hypothetical protein